MWSRKAETGPPWVAEHLGVAKRVRVAFEVNNEPAFGKRAALQLKAELPAHGAFAAVAIERARVYKTPFPEVQEVADKIGVKLGFELNGASDDAAEEEDNEI